MTSPQPEFPQLIGDIESRDFGTYGIIASSSGGSMLNLKADEFSLLSKIDGRHTVDELATLLGKPVDDLIEDLNDEGYLVSSPPRKKHREIVVTLSGVEFDGFDRFIEFLNRKLGDLIFTSRSFISAVAVAIVGFTLFAVQLGLGWHLTVPVTQPVLAFLVLRVLSFSQAGLHETAHAMVIDRHGRHVGRVGIGFYWGALSFYCDASQAMFFDRKTRIQESGAGLFTDVVFAGVVSTFAIFGAGSMWAVVLRELAVITYLGVILNMIPLLELDGYWMVADLLNRPSLHHDSLLALQAMFKRKSRDTKLALYALVSTIFGLGAFVAGIVAFWHLFGGLFHTLWSGGSGYKILAVLLILPYSAIVVELVLGPIFLLFKGLETKRHLKKSRKNAAAS